MAERYSKEWKYESPKLDTDYDMDKEIKIRVRYDEKTKEGLSNYISKNMLTSPYNEKINEAYVPYLWRKLKRHRKSWPAPDNDRHILTRK